MEFIKKSVGAELAKKILEKNTMNRPVKPGVVDFYVKEMKSGNWKEDTGDTIKISDTGKVLDGQHRLLAIIGANVTVNLHFVYGIKEDVFTVLDTGSKRTVGDIFEISGVGSGSLTAAAIQTYNRLKSGRFGQQSSRNGALSATDLLKIYESNPNYWEDVKRKAEKYYTAFSRVLPSSLLAGLYCVFHDASALNADDFMSQLCSGENITNKSILQLRKKLIESKLSPQYSLSIEVKVGLIIKTWNYFRQGREMKILKYAPLEEQLPIAI